MTANVKTNLPPCARCKGKLLLDKASGDSVCFNCGGIVYALEPLEREVRRITSHAGQILN
jgi:hypothetical protein